MDDDYDFLPQREEEEPESLRRKWQEEESGESGFKVCAHCGQPLEKNAFFCLYCGERVFNESGPIGKLALWLKKGWLSVVLLLVLFSFLLLMML